MYLASCRGPSWEHDTRRRKKNRHLSIVGSVAGFTLSFTRVDECRVPLPLDEVKPLFLKPFYFTPPYFTVLEEGGGFFFSFAVVYCVFKGHFKLLIFQSLLFVFVVFLIYIFQCLECRRNKDETETLF